MLASLLYYIAWEWINVAIEYTAGSWSRLPRFFAATVLVNLLTHPLLTIMLLWQGPSVILVLTGEVLAFLVEAAVLKLLYRRLAWGRVLSISFAMNVTSFVTGLFVS